LFNDPSSINTRINNFNVDNRQQNQIIFGRNRENNIHGLSSRLHRNVREARERRRRLFEAQRRRNQANAERHMNIPRYFDFDQDLNAISGLNSRQLRNIPTKRFNQENPEFKKQNITDCSICYDPYEDGNLLKKLPCSHTYHSSCIDEWLKMKNKCPICKKKV
jgi:hypothetical protein